MKAEATIGIVGGGIVGGAVKSFFPEAKVYDKYKDFDTIEQACQADYIFVCVPTPYKNGFDLSIMDEAIQNIVTHLTDQKNQLVVIKSTALPGTTQKYQDRYPNVNFAFNPEFLRDKTANEDFAKNDRQIIGYTNKTKDLPLLTHLMEILPQASYQRIVKSEEAELIKYAGNTFLALRVIFANQIYEICQATNINYDQVKEALISDKRIGKSHWEIFHTESSIQSTKTDTYRGYGGKCFPKDINSLIAHAKHLGMSLSLFEAGSVFNTFLNQGKYDD